MFRRLLPIALLLATSFAPAREKAENWLQVTSPHFIVVTNAGEKQGRRTADQFERMRSVFHAAFPKLQMDPGAPIIVLAIRDEKDFRALEPAAYLAKGSLRLGGLFLRAADKNYVLMRVDADGEHPYSVVYHEYTHLLLSKAAEWMPLWLNEGLAEFYQNTEIHEKQASLGEPDAQNLLLLRQNRLLPLAALFAVDQKSPYYHEENKASIFYAESWALTHYIQMTDFQEKSHRLVDYGTLLAQNVDPIAAAERSFGDLSRLEKELQSYVGQGSFKYFKMNTTTEVDDSAFKVQPMTGPQSDAVRADFLAYNQRTTDAQALLDQVLKEDPNNVSAHETKGFLEFQQRHLDEARRWYAQAVQLDSQSYVAHYYFAAIAMSEARDAADQDKVESSLRTAIKLNPAFAPAYDRLAIYLGMHHKNLDEARMMGLNAVSLEPMNVGYRINLANVYMMMQNPKNAVEVMRAAAKVAKTPEESQTVDNILMHAQEYEESRARFAEQKRRMEEGEGNTSGEGQVITTVTNSSIPQLRKRPEFVAKGSHRFLVGVLKGVHCDNPALDLTINASGKLVALHVDNYYKIQFSALGFQPSKELNPCADLENRPAKIEYVESADPSMSPQLIAVELHK